MRSTKLILAGIWCLLLSWSLSAQINSSLENDGLSILDAGVPARGADYKIGGVLVQNGFAFSQMTDQMVSAGSDLVRSKIDGGGFNMRQFAVIPYKEVNLDYDRLEFSAVNPSNFPDNDRIDWELAFTDFGDFDGNDNLERGLFLDYSRIFTDIALFKRIFFINPDELSMGINPGTTTSFDASLRVYGGFGKSVGIWSEQGSTGSDPKWGIYSRANGSGSGARFGVVGVALTSTGTKYGVYGTASGTGTDYAVYASGDMAYTGTLTDVSDEKLKRNIEDFDGLETILQLRPRTYEFRNDEYAHMNLKEGKQYGFIAQELREVIPEMVTENQHPHIVEQDTSLTTELTDYLGVRPLLLLPILTRAVQEEHEIVEDQGTRIRHLEQENQALRNRLAEVETKMEQVLGQQPGGDSDPVVLTSARLDQNFPNPYDRETAIGLFIPESIQRAELRIINAEGRVLRTIVIDDRGETKQVLEAKALQAGSYFYSLVLDGTPFSTRQMLLLK
jgi:hypothetical protein